MLTYKDIRPIADELLDNWSARMDAWNAMTPEQQTASTASGNGAPDPDYPSVVYNLAREYVNALLASPGESEELIRASTPDENIARYNALPPEQS